MILSRASNQETHSTKEQEENEATRHNTVTWQKRCKKREKKLHQRPTPTATTTTTNNKYVHIELGKHKCDAH